MKLPKYLFSFFDDKRYVWDDGVCTLSYFHKNSVTRCKEIKIDSDKEDSNKKILIIKKDCNN